MLQQLHEFLNISRYRLTVIVVIAMLYLLCLKLNECIVFHSDYQIYNHRLSDIGLAIYSALNFSPLWFRQKNQYCKGITFDAGAKCVCNF